MNSILQSIRGIIADMDGVVWRDDEAMPGAAEFFQHLNGRIAYVFATNNSSRTVEHYVEKLNRIGIPAKPEQVISSAVATAAFLAEKYPRGSRVFVIGQEGLRTALEEQGFVLVDTQEPQAALVVCGTDRTFNYDKLKLAMRHILGGAVFIGTNSDKTFPVPDGLAPGAGSLLAAVEAASGVTPQIIGKPDRPMYDIALERLKTPPQQTLMIGDRLETDIEGALKLGMPTALVLTGVSTRADVAASPHQPDFVVENLSELLSAFV